MHEEHNGNKNIVDRLLMQKTFCYDTCLTNPPFFHEPLDELKQNNPGLNNKRTMSYHKKHKSKKHGSGKQRFVDKDKTEVSKRDPKVWGPVFWEYYDYVVDTYPDKPSRHEQRAMRLLFSAQKTVLPCVTCAENYRKIYKAHPPQTQSRDSMKEWLTLIKQEVAKHSKK